MTDNGEVGFMQSVIDDMTSANKWLREERDQARELCQRLGAMIEELQDKNQKLHLSLDEANSKVERLMIAMSQGVEL